VSGDVRQLYEQLRAALAGHGEEALREVLAHVFKEFVIEGEIAPPVVEARHELEGKRFAQVIAWLQLHLDLAELELFEVVGEEVGVRVGGRVVQMGGERAPAPALDAASTATPKSASAATPTPPMSSARTGPPATAPPAIAPPAAVPKPSALNLDGPDPADGRFALLEVD
jgi:hypothetical protein